MSLTVSDIQAKSTVDRVKALSTEQLQGALDVCEQILKSLGLNTSVTDYQTVFDRVHLMMFEWYISNPTGHKYLTQGALSEGFSESIPKTILLALAPIRSGSIGTLSRCGGV